jgi:hypothetical protein
MTGSSPLDACGAIDDLGGDLRGHDHHAVVVGDDQVTGSDGDARAK